MIDTLVKIIKENKNIFWWNIKEEDINTYELYFIKQKIDMNREINVCEYKVKIYSKAKVGGHEMMGSATFNIYPTMTEDEILEKVNEQVSLCKYTMNEVVTFPKKGTIKPTTKENNFSGMTLKDAAFVAADAMFEADKYTNGYLNSSEISISIINTRYVDASGNDFKYRHTIGKIEMIATWIEKENEIEMYKNIEFDSLDAKYIQKQANQVLLNASNRCKAIKTPSLENYKVVLSGELVKNYFLHLVNKCCCDKIYSNLSDFDTGKKIQSGGSKHDLITIRLEPTMKYSTYGAPFDDEGITLRKLSIIEKGEVRNFWGSNEKSQYIKKPVYGTFKNVVVASGTLQEEDFAEENYLEIVAVSDFELDDLTGDFGSEIRLAYLCNKGKEKVSVTGGSISGNLYDTIETIRFSNELEQNNNFFGPKKILLENVKVLKG